jgi:hypothetical protein
MRFVRVRDSKRVMRTRLPVSFCCANKLDLFLSIPINGERGQTVSHCAGAARSISEYLNKRSKKVQEFLTKTPWRFLVGRAERPLNKIDSSSRELSFR